MKRREPFKFMLGLAMFGSVMLFFFLLLIYALRKDIGGNTFVETPLPSIFSISTIVILLSSLTLYLGDKSFKKDQFFQYRILMGATFFLGTAFIIMQLMGWKELYEAGTTSESRNSGGFIYLISGLHILHILIGLGFLLKIFIEALKRLSYVDSFVYSVNPPNQLKINLIIFYWHFVDILWLVLFLFLVWQHS
jgi:cytochrome c oxidase subunit III